MLLKSVNKVSLKADFFLFDVVHIYTVLYDGMIYLKYFNQIKDEI